MSSKHPDRDFWIEKYRSEETPWDLGRTSAPVRTLIDRDFPPRGRVIIPGCGRGYEAVTLAERGYQVTAVDYIREPLDVLRRMAAERGVDVEIVQGDIFDLPPSRDGCFDILLEQTCLAALEPSLHPRYETLAHRLLGRGGRLLGVFMEVPRDGGPPFDCPPDHVLALFPKSRWITEGPDPVVPPNPERPGPEYLARFTKR